MGLMGLMGLMELMELMVLDHDVGVMNHSFHLRVLMELEYNFLHHVRVESFHGHEMEDSCVNLKWVKNKISRECIYHLNLYKLQTWSISNSMNIRTTSYNLWKIIFSHILFVLFVWILNSYCKLEDYTENQRNLRGDFQHLDLECSSSSDLQQWWTLQEWQDSERVVQQALQAW